MKTTLALAHPAGFAAQPVRLNLGSAEALSGLSGWPGPVQWYNLHSSSQHALCTRMLLCSARGGWPEEDFFSCYATTTEYLVKADAINQGLCALIELLNTVSFFCFYLQGRRNWCCRGIVIGIS